jgi:CheY-like chemotaxis protein/anti-sigma regulatory factor (Ser/Thr protein kinase)
LFANLIGNAAKYTPSEGRVAVQFETGDSWVSVSVTDNGIGFPAHESERILAPFAQIDTSRTREYGGLGLGLTIVSRLVAMHGGTLQAESRGPGRGSCFTVTMATAPIHTPPDGSIAGDAVAQSNLGRNSRDASLVTDVPAPSLLIVEDNSDASDLLRELFEAEAFRIDVATNGLDALQAANTGHHDVVLCDVGLPGMDGYEIARRLRQSESLQHLKLIALTGWGSSADQALATESGFDLHLTKPVAFCDLLQHVRQQLAVSASVDQGAADDALEPIVDNRASTYTAV